MQIIRSDKYLYELDIHLVYIAQDSLNRAIDFLNKLDKEIETLSDMPYRCRPSHYYNDEHIRDFIFKGYTIPFLIDETQNKIILLDIFKWSKR
ncbi:MAG: type II toxin-antitoxin system RelE/ParE family toxin [Campylobacterota bacterium]|nr:type II toxin-antitoxin system RelE/ParE family toxin [Campylobacterota bacterium]